MAQQESWSDQYRRRKDAERRFGKSVFKLPLAKRASDLLVNTVRDGWSILEVGAGDRQMESLLRNSQSEIRYWSMDPDPSGEHDFRTLEEITDCYDCVFAFEVVEHLTLEEAGQWLRELFRITKPGGTLLLSTPNTFYPPAYLRDVTHKTPWCYDELAGFVAGAGFRPESISRIYNDAAHRYLARRFLLGWVFRLAGIDFAKQIVLTASKSN
ncbi:MAG: methyltransferase domain-containing protein [Pirellulales bacterium]|nr:methyltransferase domain-containing protein [Pirellulales bacterium]